MKSVYYYKVVRRVWHWAKGALAILASGQTGQVVQAIEHEDEKFLVKFPGVGKKKARQMILDLKGKLADVVPDAFVDLFSDCRTFLMRIKVHQLSLMRHWKLCAHLDTQNAKFLVLYQVIKEALTTDRYIKGT